MGRKPSQTFARGSATRLCERVGADAVDPLAVADFEKFRTADSDWTAMVANQSKIATLAAVGELIVENVLERASEPIRTSHLLGQRRRSSVALSRSSACSS